MSRFTPRQIRLISLATLEKSLQWYDEILDTLEDAASERSGSVCEDILALDTVKQEVARCQHIGAKES